MASRSCLSGDDRNSVVRSHRGAGVERSRRSRNARPVLQQDTANVTALRDVRRLHVAYTQLAAEVGLVEPR